MMFRFPSVICTRCTGFFCLAIIKGPPNDIYCIIEEPYKHYFTEKVSYSLIDTPKSTSSLRTIPVPRQLLSLLKRQQLSTDEYLMTGTIHYTEPRNVQRRFKNILKKCDLPPVTFHSLRHSFATRCIEKGADSKALSEILGHSSVKITLDIYVHSNMEQKREYINQMTI